MLNRIKTYVNEGAMYYGLEICGYPDGVQFHLLQLERRKQELFLVREDTFATLEMAARAIEKDVPLFLTINTGGILVKIIPLSNDSNHEALVHQAFPNLDFNSFYYELTRTKKNLIVSISRKEHVDSYLEQLVALKLNVIDISLGVASVINSIGYLDETNLYLANTELELSEASISKIIPFSEITTEQKKYVINELEVDSKYFLSFSSVLGHFLKVTERFGNLVEINSGLKRESANKRQFKLLLRSSLIGILLVLFVNFLVFNHYYEKVGKLQEVLAINDANKEQLLRLKTDVKNKEERLNAVLAMANSKTASFLDDIGRNLPASMLLSEIKYQPLQRPLRESKPVLLESGVFDVSGQVENSSDFYTWIADLEKLSWVDRVETTEYDYGSGNRSNFSIKITIHEQ